MDHRQLRGQAGDHYNARVGTALDDVKEHVSSFDKRSNAFSDDDIV